MSVFPNNWLLTQQANIGDSGATGNDQNAPRVVGLSNGNFLIAWVDNSNSIDGNTGTDIVGRIYDPLGNPIAVSGSADGFRINFFSTSSDEGDFDIAATGNGGFVMVYEDIDSVGGTSGVRFDERAADGSIVRNLNVTSSSGGDLIRNPTVAVADTGHILVAYQRDQGGAGDNIDVVGKLIVSAGVGTEFTIRSTDYRVRNPDATFSGNTFVVGYEREDESATITDEGVTILAPKPNDFDAEAKFVSIGGVVSDGVQTFGMTSAGHGFRSNDGNQDLRVAVAGDGAGGFTMVWDSINSDGSGRQEIVGQQFAADGSTVGGIDVIASSVDDRTNADIVTMPGFGTSLGVAAFGHSGGGFAVGWQVFEPNGPNGVSGTYAELAAVSASGLPIAVSSGGATFRRHGDFGGTNINPAIGVTADGRTIFAWTSRIGTNDDIDFRIEDSRESFISGDTLGNFITSRTSSNTTVNGGDGNDTLFGLDAADSLVGGNGSDSLLGNIGNDTLNGGVGLDDLQGGEGDDLLNGGNDFDFLQGGNNNDTLNGDAGGDFLLGGDGFDLLNGGADNDAMAGEVGNDTLNGEAGNDALNGGDGNDTLDGGIDNDTLNGANGDDLLVGFDGDDTLIGDAFGVGYLAGTDTYSGGKGIDTIDYSQATGAVIFSLGLATAQIVGGGQGTDSILNNDVENLIGSAFNDSLSGNNAENRIQAGDGNDTVSGDIGADSLLGENGNDSLLGGTFDDTLLGGAGNDTLLGGSGADSLVGGNDDDFFRYDVSGDATGDSTINGGQGNDTILIMSGNHAFAAVPISSVEILNFGNISSTASASFSNTQIGNAALGRISSVFATGGVTGSTAFNSLIVTGQSIDLSTVFFLGWRGQIGLIGTAAVDTIIGSSQDDVLRGSGSGDTLDGQGGFDIATYIDATEGVTIFLATNQRAGADAIGDVFTSIEGLGGSNFRDNLNGTNDANFIFGASDIDRLEGFAGADTVEGGNGDDFISGGRGDDSLFGDADNDQLFGGLDNDQIFGGSGIDILNGNEGRDTLNGGSGDDYLFGGSENDTLNGGDNNDNLFGGTGDDVVNGEGGINILNGNEGNDTLTGGALDDYIFGGIGNDSIVGGEGTNVGAGEQGDDTLIGGNNADALQGNAGNDTILGNAGNDNLSGNESNDSIDGGADVDVINGNDGDDTLFGGSETDAVRGGQGNDSIDGGTGNDFLFGEIGGDTITGGTGNDVIFAGNDTGPLLDGSADTITFNAVVDGIDHLHGFEAGIGVGDVIRLLGTGYADFNEIMSHTFDFAGRSVIVTGVGSEFTVFNVQKAQFAANDFLLI